MAEGDQIPEEGNVHGILEHPLLNSLIMDNVFSFMESTATVKDLKNFRLVCKTWSETSLKVWRKVAPLRLGPPERSIRTRSQSRAPSPGNYLPVNKYLEFMTTSQDPLQIQQKPFDNLILFGIDFTMKRVPSCLKLFSTQRLGDTNLWNFLNNGQNQLKSFGFSECDFSDLDFTKMLLEKLGFVNKLTLVNIEEWYISGQTIDLDGMTPVSDVRELDISGDVFPMEFEVMMMYCTNLEKLVLRSYRYQEYNLRNFLIAHDGMNTYHAMKKLDVMESRFFKNHLHDMALLLRFWDLYGINFNLELLTLTLETYNPNPNPSYPRLLDNQFGRQRFDNTSFADLAEIFQPLIRLLHSTLKTLKVFRAPIHNVFPNEQLLFPEEMPCLEELHLYGNLVASFAFLEQTPNLKMLRIDRHCASMANHMEKLYFPGRWSGEAVTWFRERYRPNREDLLNGMGQDIRLRLQLPHMTELHLECNLSPVTIQFLGNWMPNLKVFKGIMTDGIWKAVCEWMPDLEEVGILRGSQVGEEALTGCYNVGDSAPGEREPLNILRLRNLRRFMYLAYCGQSSLGNLSVRRGFLEMPRLGMVYICVSKQLSAEVEAALKEAILNVTIIQNTNENCQGGWDCCAEFKFLREFLNDD